MLTSEGIKKYGKSLGADLVGIASMDRFEGAPKEQDPRYIFPDAKSCIVLAFRVPRGYYRGIEEGTFFSSYTSMGYAGINEVYGPIVLRELCCYIEDNEYEAVPIPNIQLKSAIQWHKYVKDKENYVWPSIPVAEGMPHPDVMIDMRVAAFAAGLGEYGYSKVFLTPEFGPMQRFVALLTDFEFEPDPIFEGKICDRCKLCARECSGKAISFTEMDSITIAGHKCEYAKLDLSKCAKAYVGGNSKYNPFLIEGHQDEEKEMMTYKNPIDLYMRHGVALEGARGCIRECYIHLEKTGRLTRKFAEPFRKRKPWVIDRDAARSEVEKVTQTPDNGNEDKVLY